MSPTTRNWDDLSARIGTAAALAAAGAVALWAGGVLFVLLVSVLVGGMIWELVRMLAPGRPGTASVLGAAAALSLSVAATGLPGWAAALLLLAPPVALFALLGPRGPLAAGFALLFMLAGASLLHLRAEQGAIAVFWLVAVVVASDVAGYFAGRRLGGPKLWPRVSPKKTWSGTVAGWIAAAATGLAFAGSTGAGVALAGLSVVVAMAAQAGDIAQSALKRHAGVKDSSALLPGHGGLMDRFDAMTGAAVMILLVRVLTDLPGGA